mmetsp:Transcript_557/g.1314  ORF Transcript_557/g.1314 Transcript_557/m.1314 type:complete len:221 (+) Transcript_557:53-715(+)
MLESTTSSQHLCSFTFLISNERNDHKRRNFHGDTQPPHLNLHLVLPRLGLRPRGPAPLLFRGHDQRAAADTLVVLCRHVVHAYRCHPAQLPHRELLVGTLQTDHDQIFPRRPSPRRKRRVLRIVRNLLDVPHLRVLDLNHKEIILVVPLGHVGARPLPVVRDQLHRHVLPPGGDRLGPFLRGEPPPPAVVGAVREDDRHARHEPVEARPGGQEGGAAHRG